MTSTSDRARLISFVAASGTRRVFSRIANLFAGGLPFDGRAPTRLLIAPHDLRTTDPTIAADIYRGRFSLSGTAVEIGAVSPFVLQPPSDAWEEELLGFSWLRHFHAADEPINRVNARALIGDWIAVQGRGHPVGWKPQVVARRIISWLAHSPGYLAQAEPDFYRMVMRSLGRQLRYLARNVNSAPDGVPRLTAHIAMAYATLCISGLERLQGRAARLLASELDRQILPDGGHVSRDPGAVIALLLDLLPLRQTFLSRDIAPPPALMGAIDRMMPMVRFFRYGDGSFGLFNGMGRTQVDVVSAILAYDDSRGKVPDQAPHSGYQRLESGKCVILMDVGRPPPTPVSHSAHAGCLSFELSSGPARIITNCGSGVTLKVEWRQAARATAAHSTMVVGNVSSARYVSRGPLARIFGTPIISGPRDVAVTREDTPDERVVEARHDGYRRLGIIHHRRIALSRDGKSVEGQDRLTRSNTLFNRTRRFSLRFHLHPAVRASVAQDSRSVLLRAPNNETWRLAIYGSSVRLEESVYLADPKGVQRTEQIVVAGQCGNEALIRWTLREDVPGQVPRVREVREGEKEERVLPQAVDPSGRGDADQPEEDDADLPEEAPTSSDGPSEAAAPDVDEDEASAQTPANKPQSAGVSEEQQQEQPTPSSAPPAETQSEERPFKSLATPTPRPPAERPASERKEPSLGRASGSAPAKGATGEGAPESDEERIEPTLDAGTGGSADQGGSESGGEEQVERAGERVGGSDEDDERT